MKVLVVADEPSRYYYDFYQPGRLDEFDLIIGCGDLHKGYLEFLVTMARCPLIYVRGNHDEAYKDDPPEGCICIDDDIFEYQGVRFLGLGGSYRYRPDGTYMYTEWEMRLRIFKLWRKLYKHKGFDVLVTHAPAYHMGDFDTLTHRGFECFIDLMDKYRPKYFLHGHIHRNYGVKIPAKTRYHDTVIINAFDYQTVDLDEGFKAEAAHRLQNAGCYSR